MSPSVSKEHLETNLVKQLGRLDVIAKVLADSTRLGLHRSRHKGSGTDFSEYKSYVPGDDLRHLDWRLYARTDKLYVKRFETHTNLEIQLMVDASPSMSWRFESAVNKLEYAVNCCIAMAELYLQQQDMVGLSTLDAKGYDHLPSSERMQQLTLITDRLVDLEGGGEGGLSHLVERSIAQRKRRGPYVLFSDLEEDQLLTEKALDHLAGAGEDVIVFHILDQHEVKLPFKTATHLQDSETGEAFPVHYPTLVAEHEQRVADFVGYWRGFCQSRAMAYLEMHTGMNYLDILLDLVDALMEKSS